MRSPGNISASVRQRLLNLARKEKKPFNEILQHFAMERFLYRLSISSHADDFVLKGGLLLRVWRINESRPTMDIDMLGKTVLKEAELVGKIREVIELEAYADGIVFHPDSVKTEPITEEAKYQGVRIRLQGNFDTAKIHLQIDLGFGDKIFPGSTKSVFPTLLDFPAPTIAVFSPAF